MTRLAIRHTMPVNQINRVDPDSSMAVPSREVLTTQTNGGWLSRRSYQWFLTRKPWS